MKDVEKRGLLLQAYYNYRNEGNSYCLPRPPDVKDKLTQDDIFRISQQLSEKGLIEWKPLHMRGGVAWGQGKITADGVDIIEGAVSQPTFIVINRPVTVSGDNYGAIGDGNVMNIESQIGAIVSAIDNSSTNIVQKEEAKGLLKKFLEHPLVSALAGAALTTYLNK